MIPQIGLKRIYKLIKYDFNMKFNLRKTIQLFNYYLIPGFLLLSLIYLLYTGQDIYEFVVERGNNAFTLLIALLYIKPLCTISGKYVKIQIVNKILTTALSYRREFGVLAFWFAVLHGVSLFFLLGIFNYNEFVGLFQPLNVHLVSGLIGLIGMVILGLTSNKLSVMKLKRNWKRIQMVVYPTFAFACIHVAIAEQEIGPYIILGVYTILKIFAYYINKNK